MKLLNVTLSILLVLGFVMTPSCVFAYENSFTSSASISGFSVHSLSTITNLNPMVKGSSVGGKGSTSSSKKIKDSDDDDSNSTDDGNNWWIWIIVVIIIILIIFGIWFFYLRNR
ncbi:hypothetical protein [Methanobacterium spitsbergense]|uniref:Uncharacterized protein n=1 Tax=Methanobacterium spitsbergense TaxID=2874285 RepID=A0A8T5UT26_9EURY|nr:hypothetical protein [Methanobacterium spitsbergense]MBZ2165126.1 hypothetical protein [Methanobacterium spitsbergense]